MNKLTLLIHVFLFLITVSAALPANDKLTEIFYKRNQCTCTTAYANFNSSPSSGPFRGFIAFAQDETGCTTIFGAFNEGFDQKCTYDFLIQDECGKIEFNITNELDVQVTNDGGTRAFSHKFDYINLDCHSNGILLAKCNSGPYNKRQSFRSGPNFVVRGSGGSTGIQGIH
ncbi:hypothetical protein RclHR1_21340002 [Rhizophagus clarus]|uniref:Uncharacterized protein n=1 Tax=Rhizophagus clarus TaxID=94130 RepID=A0A2Z6RLU7_9GLOM|nr:hypothetical protein RclHR1_21340002 [Rhizophagus clarus]GES88667.1 hypothetical protein GLOIN_2v1708636 [Rhizophagus clarus]